MNVNTNTNSQSGQGFPVSRGGSGREGQIVNFQGTGNILILDLGD